MEFSSTEKLCRSLVCSAIRRCRISDDLCRLSVVLKCVLGSDIPTIRISISDTGVGSCLEEFQALDTVTCVSAEKWDGVLSITTTSISEEVIYHYHLNLKENAAARRLTRLPSSPKNGVKFSGTEVSLFTSEDIDELGAGITLFFQKMLILKVPALAVEVMVDRACNPGSRCDYLFLSNNDVVFPYPMSYVERLSLGLEGYVLKHGNILNEECRGCREFLKVGSGVACTESPGNRGQVVEAVTIIRELKDTSSPSCLTGCGMTTEVFYFQDFIPGSIPQSSSNTLKSIIWKDYGLTLRTSYTSRDGFTVLEWENLPPFTCINIAIHSYHTQHPSSYCVPQLIQVDRNLIKKAVKLSLDDIKQRYKGMLLSARAVKVCSYAPDLARTIAGLILSSNDLDFQGECISLLGLTLEDNIEEKVRNSIKEKIVTVIETNDRKPQRSRDPAPLLFEEEHIQEPDSPGYEDEGEEGQSVLDQ